MIVKQNLWLGDEKTFKKRKLVCDEILKIGNIMNNIVLEAG